MKTTSYTIGVDFGTDSARAVLVDAFSGDIIAESSSPFKRWKQGLWCDHSENRYRQHPDDYTEALECILKAVISKCPNKEAIMAIGVDTTGSTPCLVDESCTPLCQYPEFADNPDAMFILWKDHTAVNEAEEIELACSKSPINYAGPCGYKYSPEYTWAKILHILRKSPDLRDKAFSFVEETDFIVNILTDCNTVDSMKPSICIPAAKQLWSKEWGGFPPDYFMESIDADLARIARNSQNRHYQSSELAGALCREWSQRIGLKPGIAVCVGNCDAFAGAVGAGIKRGKIVLNIGTSACFMAIMPSAEMKGAVIPGLSGQGEGTILEGYRGYESGMSAFGDMLAWFYHVLSWHTVRDQRETMNLLCSAASSLPLDVNGPVATCHFNGRRAPVTDNRIRASISNLSLSTSVPMLFRSLVEAAAFGTKECIEQYVENGIEVREMVAIGGVAKKHPYIMQTLADVTGYPISVLDCDECCAFGSAIHAAVACGLYENVMDAEEAMCPTKGVTYTPDPTKMEYYSIRFKKYKESVENDQNRT